MTTAQPGPAPESRGDSTLDVAVIGGGQAGLALGWHLAKQRARFEILDAGPEIGHTWRSRWDSLRLFTPAQYDALPGMPFPAPVDTYPGKDQVADYLQAYVSQFGLPVRIHTRVTDLRTAGADFEITAADRMLRARQVVVATGPFQTPHIPAVSRRLHPSVTQVHNCDYRSPQSLPDGPVLVVGGGNSGLQIAAELAQTRQVELSVGTYPPMLPQRLLGRDLFWWLTRLRLMDKSTDTRLGRRIQSRGELVIGTNRRRLRHACVAFRPRLVDADGTTARFADGSSLDVGAIVWATGYRPDYSWIHVPGALDRSGHVVHRRGVTAVPGLYFLGLSWQHTRGSALLGFVRDDADHLAHRIASQRRAILPRFTETTSS